MRRDVARPLVGDGPRRAVRGCQLSLFAPRRRMPKNTAPPPTTTRAAAMPAMRPVLELAPVSARLESPAGAGALPAEAAMMRPIGHD